MNIDPDMLAPRSAFVPVCLRTNMCTGWWKMSINQLIPCSEAVTLPNGGHSAPQIRTIFLVIAALMCRHADILNFNTLSPFYKVCSTDVCLIGSVWAGEETCTTEDKGERKKEICTHQVIADMPSGYTRVLLAKTTEQQRKHLSYVNSLLQTFCSGPERCVMFL